MLHLPHHLRLQTINELLGRGQAVTALVAHRSAQQDHRPVGENCEHRDDWVLTTTKQKVTLRNFITKVES